MTTLVWFREDLRLADHPALYEALSDGHPVVALFVIDEESPGVRPLGGASRWWLHRSLAELEGQLATLGVPLLIRRGSAQPVVTEIVSATGATRVLWNRRYGGAERSIDAALKEALRAKGVGATSFPGNLLIEPWHVTTQAGTPYRVYGAFRRALGERLQPSAPLPVPAPAAVAGHPDWRPLLRENDAIIPEEPRWAQRLGDHWSPGARAASARLDEFVGAGLSDYADRRDEPAHEATSRLSPHLRWGELSPRQVWHAVVAKHRSGGPDPEKFLSEVVWREFAWHTLYARPDLATTNLNARYDAMAWSQADTGASAELAEAWRRGRTGIPIVDAGMRELWATGTTHNRVRMIVASLLTKNLGIDWRVGEAWFWETLVDADPASNPFNWQWVAGSGADAAPYFRVFNPERQAERFDPEGAYVARWAPDSLLTPPIVDLAVSRREALTRYDALP